MRFPDRLTGFSRGSSGRTTCAECSKPGVDCRAALAVSVLFPAKVSGSSDSWPTAGTQTRRIPRFASGVVVTPCENTRDALPVL